MTEVKEFHGTGDSAVRPDKPMTERSQEEADIADVVWIDVAELPEKLHTDAHRWDLERVLAA